MSFWNILLAILVFSVIIIIHEFGHFIVAKWNRAGKENFLPEIHRLFRRTSRIYGKYRVFLEAPSVWRLLHDAR